MGTTSSGTEGYALGIDLGTTFTAAAVAAPGQPAVAVPLSSRADTMPSVLHLGSGGGPEFLVGDAAERRALVDPDHVVRRFKRRIGDETPLVIGADAYHAHTLAAKLIAWVSTQVTQRQGREPDQIAVTHPAAWGSHKRELLARALAEVGLSRAQLISEPAASAYAYAHSGRLSGASSLAVYDLGGGTFDACVMRAGEDGRFALVGTPSGLPNLGGIDFDDAVLDHVLDGLGTAKTALDPADPMVVTALARLRRECVDAKEALSTDTTATIPVLLGELATSVRITRAEFEELIAPGVAASIDALESALDSADLEPGELKRLLLTGGSSRIPLVVQSLSARLGPGVALDRGLDPKLAVAMGAALSALGSIPTPAVSVPAARTAAETADSAEEIAEPAARPEVDAPPRPDATIPASPVLVLDPPGKRTHRAFFLLAMATVAMVGGTFGQHYLHAPHRSTAAPVQAHPVAPAPAAPAPAAQPAVPVVPAAPTTAPPATTVAVPTQARAPERSNGRATAPAVGPRRVVVLPGPARPAPRPQEVVQRPAYPAVDPRPDSGWTSWSPAAPAAAPAAPAPAQPHSQPHSQPAAPAAPAAAPAAAAPAADSTDSGSTEFRSSANGSGSAPNASMRP